MPSISCTAAAAGARPVLPGLIHAPICHYSSFITVLCYHCSHYHCHDHCCYCYDVRMINVTLCLLLVFLLLFSLSLSLLFILIIVVELFLKNVVTLFFKMLLLVACCRFCETV